MRSLRPILSLFALALILATQGHASAKEKLKVATTFTVIADMAQNVAGDAADVVSITKPGADIHEYQPTPGDIVGVSDADLILWNGLHLELWFEKFFERLGDMPSAVLTDGIEPMGISEGPYDGKPNPHAWMSFTDAHIYIDNIRDALSKADPENAEIYAANAKAYNEKIDATRAPVQELINSVPAEQRWLATSEGAFSYLARDLGLNPVYLWPINADNEGTPRQVRKMIDAIREHNIPAIFSESTISDKPARQVARETGIHYGGVLYVDSLSRPDGPVPTYLDMLRVTAETIVNGLKEGAEK